MRWYVARRILWAVFATYIILSVTFGLMYATPDQQAAQIAFQTAQHGGNVSEALSAYKARNGKAGTLWAQYKGYMINMITFHWGWSNNRSEPVIRAIMEAWPYSVMYAAPSVILSTIIGLTIGFYSATHRYSLTDYVGGFFSFFGLAIPNFWFGIILLLIFGVQLGWAPITFNAQAGPIEMAKQMVLPVVVLTTGTVAGQMRYSRSQALEYVSAEFVKTARAKGASEYRVVGRHIFRVASVPLMTILVNDLLNVFLTSSLLVEVVFGIPGLGRMGYRAIVNQDTALVLGVVMIPVFITVIGNLLQDIAYTIVDPRIDYGDR